MVDIYTRILPEILWQADPPSAPDLFSKNASVSMDASLFLDVIRELLFAKNLSFPEPLWVRRPVLLFRLRGLP